MTAPFSSLPGPRRRGLRKWWIGGGFVILVLVAWVVLPSIVAVQLESRLTRRLDTPVTVDDVDLSLIGPTVTVNGLRFGEAPEIEVEVPMLEARWSWRTLLTKRVPPVVRVVEPTVRVRLDPHAPPPQREQRPLSFAAFDALHVEGGQAVVLLQTPEGVVDLRVADISLSLVNSVPPGKALTTQLRVAARIGDAGRVELSGAAVPLAPAETWALEFKLTDLDVVPLNALWKSIVEMDTTQGTLNLEGEASRSKGRLRGRIVPNFVDLQMLDPDEEARHPMGEALFSEMLSGARNAMTFDVPTDSGEGQGLTSLMAMDWEAVIEGVIQRGYQRQLDTLTGYVSRIGAVKVDFGQGALRLEEVSILRDTGLVPEPFIYVKALDVRFDESVTNREVDSYKHVVLTEPVLTFVAHEEDDRRQMNFDPQWPTKVSSLPFQTEDLRVVDGSIRFIEHRGAQLSEIAITQVQLDGRRMARDLSEPGERGATIDATGLALGTAPVEVHVNYEPLSDDGNVHFEFKLDPLPLEALNPLARTHAGIDASAGTIGVVAMFDLRAREVQAETTLDLVGPKLIGDTEREIEHPVREFMLTSRMRKLHGKRLRVDVERDEGTGLFTQVGMALLSKALGTSRR